MTEGFLRDFLDGPMSVELTQSNTPTMPARISEEASQVALSPATVAFIDAHTTPVADQNLFDECPICFENYVEHGPCLQIKGLGGCTHRFCQSCVVRLLSWKMGEEKRCPICRTVWIAGVRASRRAGTSNRPTRSGDLQSQRQNLSVAAQPFVPSQSVLIDLERDSDRESYNTQVQNFNQAARAIEDVRARARSTQISRSQRRQEMRDETARRRESARESRRIAEQERHRTRQVNRAVVHRLGRRRSSVTVPVASDVVPTPSESRHNPQQDQRLKNERPCHASDPFGLPIPSTSTNLRPAFDSPRTSLAASSALTAPAPAPIASRISLDDQREKALAERETALNDRDKVLIKRTTELNSRATAFNARDTELNDQKNRFNGRLVSLLQREKDVVAREERANAKARLAQEHRAEMEKLIKKQKEEMNTLMR
jgi:hypothetical protein